MAQVRTGLSLEEKIRRVREAYEAFDRGDHEAARPHYTEDTVFHSQLRQREFKGRDAVFAEMAKQHDELESESKIHDVCASADHAVVLLEMTHAKEGERVSDRLVNVLHLDDDGRIKESWALFNPQS